MENNLLCDNVSFALKSGDNLTILWKDGLGKSTFMEICTGLIHSKYKGTVKHYGQDVRQYSDAITMKMRSRTGYVFQNSALISNHTVFDNIALPLRYHSQKTHREIDAIVQEQIEYYHLGDIQYLLPETLTTSQSKIVAFARALVVKPDILFMDEPSLGLDHESFDFIVNRIKEFAMQKYSITLMLTTSLSLTQATQFPSAVFDNQKLTLPINFGNASS
ncbi:MAG: ABC transporter [Candidatus Magnetoglobus multicellularis str. Araruama]|uniref:ABC transporter n=1 Tax=Candidatus Magnetoglobus multicellularis str. Araruama TaxID=890399 RepID=A0A1V1PCF4_9BACT|nr:MAG: ABC transporter [Candidatus Magnetoglobus multicellularis str. Araruama]